jgi:hypothetical protein
VPFSRTQFLTDIVTKKKSLFTQIDFSNEHTAGIIAVLKIESAIRNFLNSEYIRNRRDNSKFIDYYNLVLTTPFIPSSHFRSSYPFRNLEIDALSIGDEIQFYEGDDLYELFVNLKNNKKIMDTDLVSLMPYHETYLIITSGDSMGLIIDLNEPEDIVNKLPGGKPLYEAFKNLEWPGS